jgi:hypothetical protein
MIRHIPNEYRLKNDYLDKESDNIEILFLGASETACGFNPFYTKKNSFNCGHPGQSIDYSYEILKKYENHWSNLKYIVLATTYPTLFYRMENSRESWRVKNYNIYYKISTSKHLRSYAEIFNGQLLDQFFRLYKYYIKNINEINCSDKGWNISSASLPIDSLGISGKEAAKRHSVPREQQCFAEMKTVLDSIIVFSKRNGSNIIFCTPPVYKSYSQNLLNKYQLDSTINTIHKIVKENRNCTYLNLFEDTRFRDEDFLDGDHLNDNGATKLTLIIDSLMTASY